MPLNPLDGLLPTSQMPQIFSIVPLPGTGELEIIANDLVDLLKASGRHAGLVNADHRNRITTALPTRAQRSLSCSSLSRSGQVRWTTSWSLPRTYSRTFRAIPHTQSAMAFFSELREIQIQLEAATKSKSRQRKLAIWDNLTAKPQQKVMCTMV